MTLRVIIADDEPPARTRMRAMLAAHDDVDVVAEVENGRDAVAAILVERPDVVFLDIRMPELSGFEVIDAITESEGECPGIVFVTAYDAHAIRAFEVGAIDYLLKPFDQERFDRTLRSAAERVRARRLLMDGARVDPGVSNTLNALTANGSVPARLLVRRGRRMMFVATNDVDWFDAQGNYVRLHIGGKEHLLRSTMAALEARLDPAIFVRVHRSAIVNVDRIAHIEPYLHGEFTIAMRDGTRLTTSAGHSGRLREMLR